MAVIERHRTWLQRMTGTGYPGGRKPAPEQSQVAVAKPSRTVERGRSPVPMFGRKETTSHLPMIGLTVAVMVIAAAATVLFSGSVPGSIPIRLSDQIKQGLAFAASFAVLGVALYVRSLIRTALKRAASGAWTAARSTSTPPPRSPWSQPVSGRAVSTNTAQSGQAKPPPNMFGTIMALFIMLWFLWPMWASVLRSLGFSNTPYVIWLPVVVFVIWAWRRHSDKT